MKVRKRKKPTPEQRIKNRESSRRWQLENRPYMYMLQKRWRDRNPKRVKAIQKRSYLKNKEACLKRARAWKAKNRDRVNAYDRIWKAKNRSWIMPRRNKIERARRAAEPEYRMLTNLRSALKRVLKGIPSQAATKTLIGCSVPRLRRHLESKWQPGMTWKTYGKFGWHIDHIKPCSSFDLSKPGQQRACFHYTNLQPLWAFDNLSKHAKYPAIDIKDGAEVIALKLSGSWTTATAIKAPPKQKEA